MIAAMKKISILAPNTSRKDTLETLQSFGCVQIEAYDINCGTSKLDVSESVMQFERYIDTAGLAIDIINEAAPEKQGLISTRNVISKDKYSMSPGDIASVGAACFDIIAKSKEIEAANPDIAKKRADISFLSTWESLDVPMNFRGTDNMRACFFSCSYELEKEKLEELLSDFASDTYYEIKYSSKTLSNVFLLVKKEKAADVISHLKSAEFSHHTQALTTLCPRDRIEVLNSEIKEIEKKSAEAKSRILDYVKMRDEIKLFCDRLILRKEKYENLKRLYVTDSAFFLEGYVPEKKADKVKEALEAKTLCHVELSEPDAKDLPPVLFKNNSFVSPVESITGDYSMPGKGDIDPNGVMSIFYYIFFGMMFSDAGYGLLMVIVCSLLGFFIKTELKTRQFMRMFFYCGVSTVFWGFMFGGFFGDAIKSLKPLWINPVDEPLLLLIFSVGLGLVQILTGLVCKFYVDWKSGDKKAAIYDTGTWIVVLIGAVIAVAGIYFKLSPLKDIGIILALIGALGVVLTKGRDKPNIFSRLISGIVGLYDITSYVSDLLSYSRLMALGLATGVIAQVVNVMCSLVPGGIVGVIFGTLIFVAGHGLNFAINILGAYVHTNRLQYVEFYSKFYEGGGRRFTPLSMNTKYYNFMEDDEKC